MTPEQESAVREWRTWEDEWDWENELWVGGIWALRGLGYPPDQEKLAEQEAETAAWVAAGRPLPQEPTPEEQLKASEALDAAAAAAARPTPPEATR